MKQKPTVTVALVTARRTEETGYERWFNPAHPVYAQNPKIPRSLQIEMVALRRLYQAQLRADASADIPREYHHIEFQLWLLNQQTVAPDRVIVVDRCYGNGEHQQHVEQGYNDGEGYTLLWTAPKVSKLELERTPVVAFEECMERDRKVSYGCSDKNTAIALCDTDILIMMDDCCLFSDTMVEAAIDSCGNGDVMAFGHRKAMFDDKGNYTHGEANWQGEVSERCPFGIWAMPLKVALRVNGYEEKLDGGRHYIDVEFFKRVSMYLENIDQKIVVCDRARVYEIDHDMPWNQGELDHITPSPEIVGFRSSTVGLAAANAKLAKAAWKEVDRFYTENDEDFFYEDDEE